MTDFKVFVLHVLQSSDEHFSLTNQMQVGELSVLDHVLPHTLGSVFLSFCVKTEDPKLDLVLRRHGTSLEQVQICPQHYWHIACAEPGARKSPPFVLHVPFSCYEVTSSCRGWFASFRSSPTSAYFFLSTVMSARLDDTLDVGHLPRTSSSAVFD